MSELANAIVKAFLDARPDLVDFDTDWKVRVVDRTHDRPSVTVTILAGVSWDFISLWDLHKITGMAWECLQTAKIGSAYSTVIDSVKRGALNVDFYGRRMGATVQIKFTVTQY